jgi:hypothetical protein|nr:MAG TPA: hypothetical protein [Caudoviricetes sp.]DAU75909.1 MAG TPA: hypothetical protein [Caudoviricetes sp.]
MDKAKTNYDFNDLLTIIDSLKQDADPDVLRNFAYELNMFFRDVKCEGVLYTNNTDLDFFGVYVQPVLKEKDIYPLLVSDYTTTIDKYYVELDSKLFNPLLGLTNREILAIILHDIGSMINSSGPIDRAVKEIDLYLDMTNDVLRTTDNVNYVAILTFGLKDLLHKLTSIFTADLTSNVAIDDFIMSCGFINELNSAISKLKKFGYLNMFSEGGSPSTIIAWTIRIYNDIKGQRIRTIRLLRKAASYTPVRLVKREMNHMITALSRIDDSSILESVFDDVKLKYQSMTKKFTMSSIKDIEEDYYDYAVTLQNVNDEDDALLLLHKINSRMSVIDGVLNDDNPQITDRERKAFVDLYQRYNQLRNDVVAKKVYKRNYRRIYVNYGED